MPTPSKPKRKRFSMWLRRLHLYLGMFLIPWAILYGVTALLFNHPFRMTGHPVVRLDANNFSQTALATATDPTEDAVAVIAAINAMQTSDVATESAPRFQLNPQTPPRYLKDTISLRARGAGTNYVSQYNLHTNQASLILDKASESAPAPFATQRLQVENSLSERIRQSLPQALAERGIDVSNIVMATGSTLRFQLDDLANPQQSAWIAEYHIQTGLVHGYPLGAAARPDLRQFALSLHRLHTYPSNDLWRWAWAACVDLMALTLVFWALSGVVMGWQLKQQRRISLLLAASGLALFAATAGALFYSH